MLAVGPAMDGDFPQHEPPPAGSILYSPPPLQTPLCGSSVQVSAGHPKVGPGWAPPWGCSCSLPSGASRGCPSPQHWREEDPWPQLPPSFSNVSHQVCFAKATTGAQGDAQVFFIFSLTDLFIYLFEREKEGEGQTGRKGESPAGSLLSAGPRQNSIPGP